MCTYERTVNLYATWTHCSQQCDREHQHTYISHYWHMPLNIYACHMVHVCPIALLLLSKHRLHMTAYINKKTTINFYLPCYCHTCPSNKYSPQMQNLCHICKLLYMHQWGKCTNSIVTYELTGINHVTRSTIPRWQWCQHQQWCCHSPTALTK